MYNLAYKWTHEHDIKNWKFKSINPPSFPSLKINVASTPPHLHPKSYAKPQESFECSDISYIAKVQVPGRFNAYIPTQPYKRLHI